MKLGYLNVCSFPFNDGGRARFGGGVEAIGQMTMLLGHGLGHHSPMLSQEGPAPCAPMVPCPLN